MQVSINSPDSLLASIAPGGETRRLILVTGPSGSGKTRWCQALVDEATRFGLHMTGLVSPAVFEGGVKVGIDLLDLHSDERLRLVIRRADNEDGPITGDWQFNTDSLKWGNELLAKAEDSPDIILDEPGPLELEQGTGLINGIDLISRGGYRLACVVVRPVLLEIAQRFWPWGVSLHVDSDCPSEAPR